MKMWTNALLVSNALLLSACGGGAGNSAQPGAQLPFAGIRGTAAGGLAYAGAQVEAKCANGSFQAKTDSDGSYQLNTGSSPGVCVIRVEDSANKRFLHAMINGNGSLNLTPLTELLSVRLLRQSMTEVYKNPDFVTISKRLTASEITLAQAEITEAASTWADLSKTGNWYSLSFKPATSSNPAAGDSFDKLLDNLKPFFSQRALLIAQDNLINAPSVYPVSKEDDGFVPTLNANPSNLVLSPGAKFKLSAEMNYPPLVRYLRQPLKWSVSAPNAGSVGLDGDYIAPNMPGNYSVQVQREDYPALVQTIKIQVVPSTSFAPYLGVNASKLVVKPGTKFQFVANLNYPANMNYIRPPVSWRFAQTPADGSIGLLGEFVAPSAAGTYKIIAQRDDYPEVATEINVTVKP